MDLSHTKLRRTSVVGGIVCCPNPSGDADESRTQDSINPTDEEMFASKPGKDTAPIALMASRRLRIPVTEKWYSSKNEKKGKRGIRFNYERSRGQGSPRKGLTSVGKKNGQSGKRSLLEGLADVRIYKNYQTKPTRWVDVDWDAHLTRDGGLVLPPGYKNRLCGRGNFEVVDGF